MGFVKKGLSALGKLLLLGVLAATFFTGLVSVVYYSLRGQEVKVPEIVGKDWFASEQEIEGLGLKIKKRATRYSQEKPNTILEQLPKPGETVKSGQTILVVLSEANPEGNEAPATVKKENVNTSTEEEGTDIAPDKTVKTNKNTNVKKPSQTTRDVIGNKSNKNADSTDSDAANSKSNSNDSNKNAGNKNSSTTNTNKSTTTPTNNNKSEPPKSNKTPATTKTPTGGGDVRSRKVPN